MSVKSTAARFLFSIEAHEWVHGVSPRFQKCTLADTHTELSLQHPQAGGRQLIHLKACEQHLLLSWVKCSVTPLSVQRKLYFIYAQLIILGSHFAPISMNETAPASPYETWLSNHLWASFCESFFLISELFLGLFSRPVQCGCSPRWTVRGAGFPPPTQGHLSFLTAAEAAVHHNLSSPTSFPCPFHSSRVAHFQHILPHWKYIGICFSPQ